MGHAQVDRFAGGQRRERADALCGALRVFPGRTVGAERGWREEQRRGGGEGEQPGEARAGRVG